MTKEIGCESKGRRPETEPMQTYQYLALIDVPGRNVGWECNYVCVKWN
jgi:hypothetical protein